MDFLIDYIDPELLKDIVIKNPEIREIDDIYIEEIYKVLSDIGFDFEEIERIIYNYPYILNRFPKDLEDLKTFLNSKIGANLKTALEEYPEILLKDVYELEPHFDESKIEPYEIIFENVLKN